MKVSVIIANRNDVGMLLVTLRSHIEELKAVDGETEIVLVDNSDQGVWRSVKGMIPHGYVRDEKIRIFRQEFPCLFTAREMAAENALGEYILCVDSHMLAGRDMIKDLVDFMDRQEGNEKIGFAHAPINWIHQHERQSRHDRDMSTSDLGNWGAAYKYEKMITWKGMPWICRRDWFINNLNGYGALAEHKLAWGGGDGHIGIKPWLLGFENWAVPASPGIHIGPLPKVSQDKLPRQYKGDAKYRLYASSGEGPPCLGYMVSAYVLGGIWAMERNKHLVGARFGKYLDIDKHWDAAIEMGQSEKDWLDGLKVISYEDLLANRPWDDYPMNGQVGGVAGAR